MCLSIPAKVISIDGNMAVVSIGGMQQRTGLHLVEGVTVGDFLLIHAGFAIEKISEEEAENTIKLINSIIENSDKEEQG